MMTSTKTTNRSDAMRAAWATRRAKVAKAPRHASTAKATAPKDAPEPIPAKTAKKRAIILSGLKCCCGCGEMTRKTRAFLPGHDMKAKSGLIAGRASRELRERASTIPFLNDPRWKKLLQEAK
ncbi:MAG TPA: hypothetical protein VGN17_28605 [Bryobacteraceae bacterium]